MSTTSASPSIAGSIGGVPITSLISAADAANRVGAVRLQSQIDTINLQNTAITSLQNDMQTLDGYLTTLSDPQFFQAKTASSSDNAVGLGLVDTSLASTGSYDINVSQVATDSVYRSAKATPVVDGSSTVESVFGASALGTLTVGTATGGTTQLTISATTTIDQIASAMQSALGPGASVTYDDTEGDANYGKFVVSANDSLILSSGSSTFLQSAQLFNGSSVRSSSATTLTASETLGAAYGSGFVDGTFNINGVSIQASSTDTVQDLVNRINAQVPGVSASLVDGRLTVNSASTLTVSNGTGSLFNQAGLATSSATSTVSSNAIGNRNIGTALGTSGTLTVNDVAVAYSSTDTLQDLLDNITNSGAGVTATYDDYDDQIVLTSTSTGPNSITVADTGGLASFGLGSGEGTLDVGQSTIFSVNGGPQRVSSSATLDSDTLGIAGVSFTASEAGDTTLTIAPDIAAVKAGIDNFVAAYDLVQDDIAQDTKVDTDDATLDGVLNEDMTIVGIPQQMRMLLDTVFSTNSAVQSLQDIGIEGNANGDTITESDTTQLTTALTNNLQDVINLFTNANSGIVAVMSSYVNAMSLGPSSILGDEITNNDTSTTFMQSQIQEINQQADTEKTSLESEYAAYESAFESGQSTLSYLGGSSSSSNSDTASAGGIL